MKDNKHIQSFNEHQENLNITAVSGSFTGIGEMCKRCSGDGWVYHSKGGQSDLMKDCPKCDGKGVVENYRSRFAVDWKGIPKADINQISHEVRCWAKDYEDLQDVQKLLGEPIGRTFKDKFDEWIPNRIKMVLDRDNDNCT